MTERTETLGQLLAQPRTLDDDMMLSVAHRGGRKPDSSPGAVAFPDDGDVAASMELSGLIYFLKV